MAPSSIVLRHRRSAIPYTILFALTFIAVLLCTNRSVNVYDEGVILFGATRILHGDVLHRDFYANYGPGQFYSVALLFKLFSPSVLVERLWDAFTRSLSPPLVFAILVGTGLFDGRRLIPWIAALATIVWLACIGFPGYPVFPALAATLASVACLLPVVTARPLEATRKSALLASGILVGAVTLFRYDVGFFVAAIEGGVIAARFLTSGRPVLAAMWDALAACLWFSLGLALLAGPLGLGFMATGAVDGFVLDVITLPSRSYVLMRSLPLPGIPDLVADPISWAVYLPLVVAATAIAVIPVIARSPGNEARAWLVGTVAVVTLVLFSKGFVRISGIHMAMAIVVSMPLLAILVECTRQSGTLIQAVVAGTVMLAVACTGLEAAQGLLTTAQTVIRLKSGEGCQPVAGLERLRCFTTETARLDAIRYVRHETTPDEPIYVGLGRHDKIVVNDVLFYFLAGRRSATGWHHMDPGVQTTATVQQQMIADLERQCPRIVVLETGWDDIAEPNGSAISSGVRDLDDYIEARYEPVARFGSLLVQQRVPGRAGAPACTRQQPVPGS